MMSFLTAEINGGYRIAGWVFDSGILDLSEIILQCIFLRNGYYTYILYPYTISMNYNRMTLPVVRIWYMLHYIWKIELIVKILIYA